MFLGFDLKYFFENEIIIFLIRGVLLGRWKVFSIMCSVLFVFFLEKLNWFINVFRIVLLFFLVRNLLSCFLLIFVVFDKNLVI